MSRIILTRSRSRSRTPSRTRKAQIAAYHILAATARKEDPEFGHAAAAHIYQIQQRDKFSKSRHDKPNTMWLVIDCVLLLVALGLVVSSRCAQNSCDVAATTLMASFVTFLTYLAREIDEGESPIRVFLRILSICFITDLFKIDEVDMQRVMR